MSTNPYAPPTAEVTDVHPPVLRIRYENRYVDFLWFNVVHQLFSPLVQIFCAAFPVLFGVTIWHLGDHAAPVWALLAYIATWVIQILFNAIYLYSRKNRTILTEHVLEIQDEALLEQNRLGKLYSYWSGIVKVVSRPGFVAIYVTPFTAHIIPNRAFSSRIERADFLATVQEKIRAAKV
jgi:cell division protein FtsB